MKIVILGGYGTFGGRLVDLIADEASLEIHVAGRDLEAARRFCAARQARAKLVPVRIDRDNAYEVLGKIKPFLVVDASGPFQVYGDNPDRLARAVLAAGANYIDLADAADFVNGIAALDEEARAAGLFALSGMSSFPVLTAAVVWKLAADLDGIDEIRAGIAPSPHAIVGQNVIRAIASYSGKPVDVLLDGQWTKRAGFFDSRVMTVNVPGEVPLAPIRFALAEVPDLKLIPRDWPSLKTMWVGAGPTPALMHRLLWLAAGLVKWRIVPSLLPVAPLMNWAVNAIRWGEHRGGMIVEVRSGTKRRGWHLLAEGDGGPFIPSMAAEGVIRRCLAGKNPPPGARAGHRDLELADYGPLFKRFAIRTGFREQPLEGATLYQSVMGEAFNRLAPPLRDFHAARQSFHLSGKAKVERGTSALARLVGAFYRFPAKGEDVDVKVMIDVEGKRENWARSFAGLSFGSRQWLGTGRYEGLLVESFGLLNFAMGVIERESGLELVLRGWDFAGLPLAGFLMPTSTAREHGSNGRFNFDVEIGLPLLGQIVRYRGWLEPDR